MSTKELLAQFHEIATNPAKVKADYLAKGRKICCIYTMADWQCTNVRFL